MTINHNIIDNRVDRLVEESLYRFGNDYGMVVEFLIKKMKEAKQAAESQLDKGRQIAFTLLFRAIKERVTGIGANDTLKSVEQLTIEL